MFRRAFTAAALAAAVSSVGAGCTAATAVRADDVRADRLSAAEERRAYSDLAEGSVGVFERRIDALEAAAQKEAPDARSFALKTADELKGDVEVLRAMIERLDDETGAMWASRHDQIEQKLWEMEQDYARAVERLAPVASVADAADVEVRARAGERFEPPTGAPLAGALDAADSAYPYDAAVRLQGIRDWIDDLEIAAIGLTGDEGARVRVALDALKDQVSITAARIERIASAGNREQWMALHSAIEADLEDLMRGWVNAAALLPEDAMPR